MASRMSEMYNIARDKQKVKEKEFDPYASAAGSAISGVSAGLEQRAAQPGKNVDMFLKLLDVAKKQGEMKRQQEIDQRNREVHQRLFSNLKTGSLKTIVDKEGKPVNSTAALIEHHTTKDYKQTLRYNSTTGAWDSTLTERTPAKPETKKKEFTNFEKGKSIREQVEKEKDSYRRAFQEAGDAKEADWSGRIKQANKLQKIREPIVEKKPFVERRKEKGGRIGRFVKGLFGDDSNDQQKVKKKTVKSRIEENIKKLEAAGASAEEIQQYKDDMGY